VCVLQIPGAVAAGFSSETHRLGRGALTERESNETMLAQSLQVFFVVFCVRMYAICV